VRLETIGESHDGEVRVFFELNGQPRDIRVPDRHSGQAKTANPKADPANPAHIGAPLPGTVARINVSVGETVEKGALVASIEAMKMETGLHAERGGVVKAVIASVGAQVDAKDLLIELE
jgi:pyruvate carboxylase